MITVKSLLETKGYDVWHVLPETTVHEALLLMAKKEIGAVVVLKEGKVEGIFSERDYVRNVVTNKGLTDKSPVSDFMTKAIISVKPQSDLLICMVIMTNMRVRHLPVIENNKLIGIITIGDVVNSIIQAQTEQIEDLESYIVGSYGPKK